MSPSRREKATAAAAAGRKAVLPGSPLTDYDVHLFNEGSHYRLYEKLGAHPIERDGVAGTGFVVWAPNAESVSVIGDFNGWNVGAHVLHRRGETGLWEGFIPGVGRGANYKYHVVSRLEGYRENKADPYGFWHEKPPRTASVVWDLDYTWNDAPWLAERAARQAMDRPMSIYEMHLGSWIRDPAAPERLLSYGEIAPRLAAYVRELGFTHVELLPVMEHPYYPSWGYQLTGYFAPTARYGTPQDFMRFVDVLHQHGIGVILDWVPSHFATDAHGLGYFDGTHLYEHADRRQGFHPDWQSYIFNYGRNEVRSFLLSSALFWLDRYHADGLRVDAVASMLYLDYARQNGDWVPNAYGGKENIAAIEFMRQLNQAAYRDFPGVHMIAEESTSWSMVTQPPYVGGLGFGLKWDMGWMNDTLRYMGLDPVHRRYHHNTLTFRMLYAYAENFILPLSHDEVVHGKAALLAKMPGDDWQKFASLRLLFGYQFSKPGKKLLFMGGEFGQWREWLHDESLDWHLLEHAPHRGLQRWVADLNRLLREQPALHEVDFHPHGFEWMDCSDHDNSVLAFVRRPRTGGGEVLVVLNFTPVPRTGYRVGVPRRGTWREVLNSDAHDYGGSGLGNLGGVEAVDRSWHGQPCSLELTLPPLAVIFLRNE
ncbi:MAG: 1,4-alpha-glucan branching protein GlgB [Planctomycetes bacterium]|nr:1,4-alpha-glucan branching protein GlgB [Planctomycetota bacterium]